MLPMQSNGRAHRLPAALLGVALAAVGFQAQAQSSDVHEGVYNGEIGRIINENCVVCHQEGGIGPMQFENYEQVRPWAPLISLRVANREMPPYAYDQHIGIQDLEGDWRLQQDEIDAIVAWAEAGAPLGDADAALPAPDLPDPSEWTFAGQFGQPDLIIPSNPIDIPANVLVSEQQIEASGNATVRQTDLGLEPFSVGLGALSVRDELELKFRLIARPSQ